LPNDFNLSFYEIVTKYGYRHETHDVKTEDGYILGALIIYKDSPFNIHAHSKPVIYLQHGLADSSDCWIVNKENSIAFVFADAGYDVWLGNSRGNYYSLRHSHLSSRRDASFWDFSFVEMSKYDVKATVLYIKNAAGLKEKDKITYVGHSQGT